MTRPKFATRFDRTHSVTIDAPEHTCLLVAIPALNEGRTIAGIIERVPRAIAGIDVVETLVIDDGSDDDTAARSLEAGARVVHHGKNRGLGCAFRSILDVALEMDCDYLVTLDGDGQFDPRDIPSVLEPVASGSADFSTASRFLDRRLTPRMPRARLWGNLLMSRLVSSLAGRRISDVSCGMRCYSRDAMLRLSLIGRFTYTQETVLDLSFKNLTLVEVPLVVRGTRRHGTSRVAGNLAHYAFRTGKIILRCYRDYRPIQFFGSLGVLAGAGAVSLALFSISWYLTHDQFSPHKWAAIAALCFAAIAAFMFHLGILGDMLKRQRLYLEELLFRQRCEVRRRS